MLDGNRKRAGALLGCLLACAASEPPRSATAETTPVRPDVSSEDGDFADPFVLRDQGRYYAFGTGIPGTHLQVKSSADLVHWERLGDALPVLPAWAAAGYHLTWAPSVLARQGKFVLFYTTADSGSGFQCISRATSARPEGPYVDDSARPFICQVEAECGSIDPSPFVDLDGEPYLLWKSDENSPQCRKSPHIWSQRLSNEGTELVGSPAALLGTDAGWEGPLIEGPSMIRYEGRYLLFYSANRYDSADYAIGYARCPGPLQPCQKLTSEAPLFKSIGSALGPGGQEVFSDSDGGLLLAYHAWTAPRTSYASGGARSLRIGRLRLKGEQTPELLPIDAGGSMLTASDVAPDEQSRRSAQ